MFSLDQFPASVTALLRNRQPADLTACRAVFATYGGLPAAYEQLMADIGPCEVKGPDEPNHWPAALILLTRPVSAMFGYYRDRQILDLGATGDVLIVATESTGAAYGFDTGADLRFVTVDNFRIVTPMPLLPDQWLYGLLACWPQDPVSYAKGRWQATDGRTYSAQASESDSLPPLSP